MTKVVKLNGVAESTEFLNKIRKKELLVYEDVQGSKIYVRWDGAKFEIKHKSLRSDPLNFVDLAIQKFYNAAYAYLHTLPKYVTDLLNTDWWFCFEYFPDNQPAHVEYTRVPRHGLILTCIVKSGKHVYEYEEIAEYSRLFDVDMLPVIFKGKLSDKQVEVIDLFLRTSERDLKFIFGSQNFAHFFYKILNPRVENSFLMDRAFNDNVEKFVIKIDGDSAYSFDVLNPVYHRMTLENDTSHVQVYSMILVSFLEYLQLERLEDHKPDGVTKDELYVALMCVMFNKYMADALEDIQKWEFEVPAFFREDKFRINTDLIPNTKTVDLIHSSSKVEYTFKVILGSFHRRRNKPVGVMGERTVELFNDQVDQISVYLDGLLQANREYTMKRGDLLDFNAYFKVAHEEDAAGDVYPDLGSVFGDEEGGGEKKGKKGKGAPGMPSKKKVF